MNLWKSVGRTRFGRGGLSCRFGGRWTQTKSRRTRINDESWLPRNRPNVVDGGQNMTRSLLDLRSTFSRHQERGSTQLVGRGVPYIVPSVSSFIKLGTSYVRIQSLREDFTFPEARMAAPFFLAPLLGFLKSGTALKVFSVASRVAVGLAAPLRLRSKYLLRLWHGPDYKFHNHSSGDGSSGAHHSKRGSRWRHPHFKKTTMVILGAPFVLFVAGILASLERTPIWGRWRVIMISTDEEAMLVEEFLRPGTYRHIVSPLPEPNAPTSTSVKHTHTITTAPRDWLAILRVACGEPAQQPAHPDGSQYLLGTRVLDPRTDWRARWVQDVLMRLEDGVRQCGLTLDESSQKVVAERAMKELNKHKPPPVDHPLTVRPALLQGRDHDEDRPVSGDKLVTRYGSLVLDAPSCNAFSLGFGPALAEEDLLPMAQEAPGVVVMYTGLLDEIMHSNESPPTELQPTTVSSSSGGIFGIFSVPTTAQQAPIFSGPTPKQTEQLAVTLAHELGHLLLSHSLESWASQSMYDILIEVASDMTRTMLYPLTAFLGPVFNDWFGRQVKVNARLGLTLASSCDSRRAEIEADLLALRLLQAAGFDPRSALDVWGPDGLFQRVEKREAEEKERDNREREEAKKTEKGSSIGPGGFGRVGDQQQEAEDDGNGWLARGGFLKTHPATEERYRRIVEELKTWEVRRVQKE